MAKDPVCGMSVDEEKAAASTQHQGETYYFYAEACKRAFEKDPAKYVKKQHRTVVAAFPWQTQPSEIRF